VIHGLLDKAFKVASVVKQVERPSRVRLGIDQNIGEITPLEALEKYLQVRAVPEERAETLLRYARRVMDSAPVRTD
jgi:hypothetical protein